MGAERTCDVEAIREGTVRQNSDVCVVIVHLRNIDVDLSIHFV
jgi:hypothetical protein